MRKALVPQRVRTINGSFAAIEHRFLRHGFWTTLEHHELLLYFFPILVASPRIREIVHGDIAAQGSR